ncbi:MAG: molybdenum cofactor biosynthesis protein MoaE [Phycisphaerales bacterium]
MSGFPVISVAIVDGPVPALRARESMAEDGAGAEVVFEGMVRPLEHGAPISGLDYEAYEPMAGHELARLAREVAGEHGLRGLTVVHSRGFVGAGKCSVRVVARGLHRAEALAAVEAFLDRMKRDVPIWKRVVEAQRERGQKEHGGG